MQAGDFMMATNILLSGNNYYKVSHLFNYMNMGFVGKDTFFNIQDTYCLGAIKEFWEEKRSTAIKRLQNKDGVVVLGISYVFSKYKINTIMTFNVQSPYVMISIRMFFLTVPLLAYEYYFFGLYCPVTFIV